MCNCSHGACFLTWNVWLWVKNISGIIKEPQVLSVRLFLKKKESLDASWIYILGHDSEVFTMALISFALLSTNKNNPQQNTCANQFTTFPERHSVVGECMLTPQRHPWHHKHLQAPLPWYEGRQTRFTFLSNQSQQERNTDTEMGGGQGDKSETVQQAA